MTEKNYNPNQKEKKALNKQKKAKIVESPIKETVVNTEEKNEKEISSTEEKIEEKTEKKAEDKKTKKEIKKPIKKIKKEEVYVNARSVPISTKYAISLCKFVKGKRIGDAIRELEQVVLMKKPVPMKGEYAHKKGKGMSGGKYPQRAARQFIILLKSLLGNSNNHEITEPVIAEASANIAPSPRGRFGRVRRKRTHVMLKAVEMKIKDKKIKEEKK